MARVASTPRVTGSPQHIRDRDEQGTQPIRPGEQGDSSNRVQGTRAPTGPRKGREHPVSSGFVGCSSVNARKVSTLVLRLRSEQGAPGGAAEAAVGEA